MISINRSHKIGSFVRIRTEKFPPFIYVCSGVYIKADDGSLNTLK